MTDNNSRRPRSASPIRIVMIGPPGSGKGTLGATLSLEYPPLQKVSTGDYFRRVTSTTQTGEPHPFSPALNSGRLLPDNEAISYIQQLIAEGVFNGDFLLDGFPRTLVQAEALTRLLAHRGTPPLTHAVLLQVSEVELRKRVSQRRVCSTCGAVYNLSKKPPRAPHICNLCKSKLVTRPDDSSAVFTTRLREFKRHISALTDYYISQGILHRLQATGPVRHTINRLRSIIIG